MSYDLGGMMPEDSLALQDRARISISLGESHFREFKSAWQGPPDNKEPRNVRTICRDVAEALVAFANADGGEILIGVEDNGNITGISHLKIEDIAKILNASNTHVFHKTPLANIKKNTIELDGKTILSFSTPKSSSFVHQTADGRCLRRNDLETIPFSAAEIQFDRQEITSREYDRQFVDGCTVKDLDADLLRIVSDQILKGMSAEKCLQYLGLAEYSGPDTGLRLRRAALLLFATEISKWHPRCQVRLMKVNGTNLGTGSYYNVSYDEVVSDNVCKIIDSSWEKLRQYLIQTIFHEDARFKHTYVYPENACREALVNAVAHRDYSNEGVGIEIFIFDDRIEFRNPGSLLSSIKIEDIQELRGIHQSRNSNIARALREIGFMRELGEGMRRIFELMQSNELAPPEVESLNGYFTLSLHHRPMYSKEEVLWLEQFEPIKLDQKQKSIILLGRNGELISPQDIIDRVGIIDIEDYRKLLYSLQKLGIIHSEVPKNTASREAKLKNVGIRSIPRFKVVVPKSFEQSNLTFTGNPMKIRKTRVSGEKNGVSVYVANLPKNIRDRDIYDAMICFGKILHIYLPRRAGHTQSFGFVEFEEQAAADDAIAAPKPIVLGGRALVVRPSHR